MIALEPVHEVEAKRTYPGVPGPAVYACIGIPAIIVAVIGTVFAIAPAPKDAASTAPAPTIAECQSACSERCLSPEFRRAMKAGDE